MVETDRQTDRQTYRNEKIPASLSTPGKGN